MQRGKERLGNPMDRAALWATVQGVSVSRTMTEQLKQQNSKTFKPEEGRKREKKEQKTI